MTANPQLYGHLQSRSDLARPGESINHLHQGPWGLPLAINRAGGPQSRLGLAGPGKGAARVGEGLHARIPTAHPTGYSHSLGSGCLRLPGLARVPASALAASAIPRPASGGYLFGAQPSEPRRPPSVPVHSSRIEPVPRPLLASSRTRLNSSALCSLAAWTACRHYLCGRGQAQATEQFRGSGEPERVSVHRAAGKPPPPRPRSRPPQSGPFLTEPAPPP